MIAEALWHLEIEAGAEVPVLFPRDIQITNAALTETIGDINDRTVLKLKFQRPNPREIGRDDEDDSEYDSEDDEDFDGLSPEDLESDADDDAEVKALKAELKKNGAAVKGGDAEGSDDEDDEDFSDDEEPVDIALCALTPGKIEQVQLNLVCNQDDVVLFRNLGKNTIHLLGNYINQAPFEGRDDYDDMSDDEEDYSFDEEDEEEGSDIDMADLEKVVGRKGKSDSHRFEEVAEEKAAKKAAAAPVADSKKRKAEEPVKKVEKKQKTDAKAEAPVEKKTEKKAEKAEKKVEKKADKPEQTSSKKTTLPSGLIIEDVKVGDGPVAKKGKRCGMRYIGKLTNGKQFDANTAGAPFVFRLGAGEVIKGWDQGVSGMAVGGERKLTVPAALAYGNQKIPGIPANSTLVFDIKLVNVK